MRENGDTDNNAPNLPLNTSTFRVIVDGARDGRWNMAVDEALMEFAGIPGALPVIRFYSFAPPTLSVGRFQQTHTIFNFEGLKRDGITFVRRPSGGQAVLHDQEVTYSVAAGKHLLGRLGKRELYRFILPILISGLQRFGISGNPSVGGGGSGNPDCFASTGEYEIKSEVGRKLIGSAQMVSRSSVLQHGSIPLGKANRRIRSYILGSAEENTSSSLSEETDTSVSVEEATAAFLAAVESKVAAKPSELTPQELSRAEEFLRERYETDKWNRKY